MPKKQAGDEPETPVEEDPTKSTPPHEGGDDDPKPNSLSDDPEVQKLIQQETDRRITLAQKKWARERAEVEKSAADKARKEEEEKRLLEDQKFQELADLKTKEAEEAKRKLEEYERTEKVHKLLDNHQIVDPTLREMFKSQRGELADLDERMAGFQQLFKTAVDKAVKEQLGTSPPPDGGKPPATPSLRDELKAAEEEMKKTGDATKYMAIAGKLQAEARPAP